MTFLTNSVVGYAPLMQYVPTLPDGVINSSVVKMSKTRPNITIDGTTWERFKLEVDNASRTIENFMKNFVEEENEDLETREETLEREIETLEENVEEMKEKISKKETELEALKTKQKRQEERNKKMVKALRILSRKKSEDTRTPLEETGIFRHWKDVLDMSDEELLSRIEEYEES